MMLILTIWDILDTSDPEDEAEEKKKEQEKTRMFQEDHAASFATVCRKIEKIRAHKLTGEFEG